MIPIKPISSLLPSSSSSSTIPKLIVRPSSSTASTIKQPKTPSTIYRSFPPYNRYHHRHQVPISSLSSHLKYHIDQHRSIRSTSSQLNQSSKNSSIRFNSTLSSTHSNSNPTSNSSTGTVLNQESIQTSTKDGSATTLNSKHNQNKIDDPNPNINHPQNRIVGRSGKLYSPTTVRIVETIGKLLGYTLQKSTAVTLTSDYYDRCAARFELEKEFWVEECQLPDSFQTWFQVTQIHMWLITVRFRSMEKPLGNYYLQEFINHSFLDTEERIRGPRNKISQGTLIKNYMKILLDQHRGFQIVLDYAISREFDPSLQDQSNQSNHQSDQFLASAIWRNIFGAAWGRGMGGVKGIFDSNSSTDSNQSLKSSIPNDPNPLFEERPHTFENDIKFAEILERLVIFIRKELVRLDQVTDKTIITGRLADGQTGLTQFNKI